MKLLVACEYSGIVREAFAKMYPCWYVCSCDILPTEKDCSHNSFHHIGNVLDILYEDWDMMIAHPPCTYLAISGARWFNDEGRREKQQEALQFVKTLLDAPILHIALENPVGIISTHIRKPDQYIQPYEYGHNERKKTGLWLRGLPLLQPTHIITENIQTSIHHCPPSKDRGKIRSKTFQGIADAMAIQWGSYVERSEV